MTSPNPTPVEVQGEALRSSGTLVGVIFERDYARKTILNIGIRALTVRSAPGIWVSRTKNAPFSIA